MGTTQRPEQVPKAADGEGSRGRLLAGSLPRRREEHQLALLVHIFSSRVIAVGATPALSSQIDQPRCFEKTRQAEDLSILAQPVDPELTVATDGA